MPAYREGKITRPVFSSSHFCRFFLLTVTLHNSIFICHYYFSRHLVVQVSFEQHLQGERKCHGAGAMVQWVNALA